MKYYINFNDFGEFQNAFQEKLDEFNEEVYKLFKFSQVVEWVGLGHDKTISSLYERIEEFNKISENLNKFLEFMRVASDNYADGSMEVKTIFQEMQDIIDDSKI